MSFEPLGDQSDGTVTHSYAVPYVGPDECLVTRRTDGEWTIPGGTLEPGEEWLGGLRRELREETGSRIDVYQPIGAYRCLGDRITYRMVSWADVTQVEEPMDPDARLPSSIAEVRRTRVEDAAGLFSGRNHHYSAIYRLSTLVRARSVRQSARKPVTNLTLREVGDSDALSIVRIYIESWNEGFAGLMPYREADSELIERWRGDLMQPTHRWSVATIDEEIVGFIGVGPSRDPVREGLGELDTVAVDPAYWRRGIGRLLMARAIDQLRTDYDAAILWTLESTPRGQRYYEAMGWHRDGITRSVSE